MADFLDSAFPFIIVGVFIALFIGLIYKKNQDNKSH